MDFKNNGISAKVICDSISESDKRITTLELEYPRFIHSELMTHRMISKNCASSRAIPVDKVIEQVELNPAMPIHWGKNQSGMQAGEDIGDVAKSDIKHLKHINIERTPKYFWLEARDSAVRSAIFLSDDFKIHKQVVNRLLEPFQMMKTLVTATEWGNFFWLRLDKDAQPEIQELAGVIKEAIENSTPQRLYSSRNMWHLPYIYTRNKYSLDNDSGYIIEQKYFSQSGEELTLEEAKAISASCCAQVSYRATNYSKEKALDIYDKLIKGAKVHASPFEHQATPMRNKPIFDGYNDNYEINFDEGETSYHKELGFMSGNLAGWIQHRQLLEGNTKW